MMKIVLTTEKRKKNVRSQQDLQVNQNIEKLKTTVQISLTKSFEEKVKSNSRARDIVAYVV